MSTCVKTSGLSDDDSVTTNNKVLIQDINNYSYYCYKGYP